VAEEDVMSDNMSQMCHWLKSPTALAIAPGQTVYN